METIDIVVAFSSRGFDAVGFLVRADEWRLRTHVGLRGIREIKEQIEFEDAEPEGKA